MKINKRVFGKSSDGILIEVYTISTDSGIIAEIMNYGGTVISLKTPDRYGKSEDVVLGFDNLEQYLGDHPFFGGLIGRYANRIAGGKFKINDVEYQLSQNEGKNQLHGGINKPFHRVYWKAEEYQSGKEIGLKMTYFSPDGEEGYPGNLNVEVFQTFSNDNEYKIKYNATTDKPTHVNITQHNYYNLNGCKKEIFNQQLMILADKVSEVNEELLPTGKFIDVKNTPLDLTSLKNIGEQIKILKNGGFDHNYILNKKADSLELSAKLYDPQSGRIMEVFTVEPGLQLYTSNGIGEIKGKYGLTYHNFYAVCLESQHFPDSPNHPNFPTTLLLPGQKFESQTIYKFSVK